MLCGSATLTYGMRALLTEMVELLPVTGRGRAARRPTRRWWRGCSRRSPSRTSATSPSSGSTPGGVKNGQDVWNAEHAWSEKLNHLTVQQGRERIEVPELRAGDIGSVAKLQDTHTNDTFCRRAVRCS